MVALTMPITILADKPEELPEALRSLLKPHGDRLVLSEIPQGFALENIVGLKTSLSEERAARKAAEQRAKLIDGVKDEDLPEALSALEMKRAGTLKSSKDIEDYKTALEGKSKAELQKAEGKAAKLTAQLRKQLIDSEATKHLLKHGGGDALRILLPIVRQAASVEEDDQGELRVVLKDEAGKPIISKKPGNNDPMDWEEYVGQMREAPDMRVLFKAQATGGSGAASQTGGSGRAATHDSNLSAMERLARANEKAMAK